MGSHEYLMEVEKFFGGRMRFEVMANSKEEAMKAAKEYINTRYRIDRDNIIADSLKVVKKLKPSFGA